MARGWIGLFALALTISACATPISVTQVDSQTAQRELTRNVLSTGELSRFSQIVLNRADLAERFRGRLSNVDAMTPGSPLITELIPAPLAPGVIGHSIIAVKGDGPFRQDTDGVVVYESAHLDGMASELVVTSGHSVQQNAEAIEEVRRILLENPTRP